MSKTFGYIMLLGLAGAAVLSIALLMWVWIRFSNPEQTTKLTPTPTSPQSFLLNQTTLALIDARRA